MTGKSSGFYSQVKQLSLLTTIPIIILLGPLIGYFIGAWLDRRFGFYPWVTLLFVCLGAVASGREVANLLKQILKEERRN